MLPQKGKPKSKSPVEAEASVGKSEQISKILENAKNSPGFEKFTDEQKEISLEIAKNIFERYPTLDFPKTNPDGTIEMDLMDGGRIVVNAPKGNHVMSAQREMDLCNEKGDKDEMLPIYVMAACSNIDGEPVSIFDLTDKLTARDFKNLVAFFRVTNLL